MARYFTKNKMLRSAAKFFDGMSNFRLVFMTLLFCDIRYMFPYVYYPLVVTAVIWGFCLFIKKMMINKGIQKIRFRKIIYLFFACACLSVLLHCTTNFAIDDGGVSVSVLRHTLRKKQFPCEKRNEENAWLYHIGIYLFNGGGAGCSCGISERNTY